MSRAAALLLVGAVAPVPGTTQAPLPNWDRVVYLVGVNRQPIGWAWGWQHSIPLRDPGP